jgi:S1-C subfamily serine protease
MSGLDWGILALLFLFALAGFYRGFIVGALSFAGFLGGAFVGTRLAPLLLPRGYASPYAPLLGLAGALFGGSLLAIGFEALGIRARRRLRFEALYLVDGVLGAVLSVGVGLGVVWLVAAVLMQTPFNPGIRRLLGGSAIIRALDEALPPSGPILSALARLDPLPQITGPSTAGLAPPEAASLLSPAVRTASHSVVRILGTACGLAIEGSGWVAEPDLVVTNAHVVAGETDTVVERNGEPPELPAELVSFDPQVDLALLYVPGLDLPPLSLSPTPPAGTAGVVAGYPEDGPLQLVPARVGETQDVVTQNAYGEGPVTRLLTPLRGVVRPGNSGGPVLSSSGQVLATVFAATTSGPPGGYGVANKTVEAVLDGPKAPVGATRCDPL